MTSINLDMNLPAGIIYDNIDLSSLLNNEIVEISEKMMSVLLNFSRSLLRTRQNPYTSFQEKLDWFFPKEQSVMKVEKTKSRFEYIERGIRKDLLTGNYQATVFYKGKPYSKSFESLREAKNYRKHFNPELETLKNVASVKQRMELMSESNNGVEKGYTVKTAWEKYQFQIFPTLEASSRESKLIRIKSFSNEFWNLPMTQLAPESVDKWIEEMKQNAGPKLCNLKLRLDELRTLCNWYKSEIDFKFICPVLKRHYAQGLIRKRVKKEKKMTIEEFFSFVAQLSPPYSDLVQLTLWNAGRIGEIAGLQKKSVHLNRGSVDIDHNLTWSRKTKDYQLNDYTKTKQERLDCPLPENMITILRDRIKQSPKTTPYVFSDEDGKPLMYRKIYKVVNAALKKAGLSDRFSGTHFLRHTMATFAREVTGTLDGALSITRHASIKECEKYAAPSSTLARKVIEGIDKRFQNHVQTCTEAEGK